MSFQFLSQCPTVVVDLIRLSLWLAILVAIFVPLEQFFARPPREIFRKGMLTDIGYFFVSGLAPAVLMSVPIAFLALLAHRLVPARIPETTASWPLPVRVLAGLVAGEIGYYWAHRLSHEIPFLWRFHAIHHSAEHVDFLVNTRAHPVDMVFGHFCGLVPIYLLGLGGPLGEQGTLVPMLSTIFGALWGFFIHANVKWRFGPLEWLISTPAFHHWHHTLDGPINRNYASTLPWVDWIFGTHHLPQGWPEAYGIRKKIPDTLAEQMFYPFTLDRPSNVESSAANPPSAVE